MARSWTSRLAFAFTTSQIIASVSAQDVGQSVTATTGPVASSTSTPSAPRVHIIKAGAGGFEFEPQQITNVAVGDTVTFEFYPPDHSVARAEFGSACVPYEYTGKDKKGFWSGTQLVDTVAEVRTHQHIF